MEEWHPSLFCLSPISGQMVSEQHYRWYTTYEGEGEIEEKSIWHIGARARVQQVGYFALQKKPIQVLSPAFGYAPLKHF